MATLAELRADLTSYRTARDAILSGGQSYTVGGVTFTRARLSEIEATITRLEHRIAAMERGGAFGMAQPVLGRSW